MPPRTDSNMQETNTTVSVSSDILNKLFSRVDKLASAVTNLETDNERLNAIFIELKADNKHLESTVANLETDNKRLDATIIKLKADKRQLVDTIAQLQKDSASVSADLRRIQVNTGTTFPLFSRLPSELRHKIWKLALQTPQIHIIQKRRISASRLNKIMQACHESRCVGLSLQLDYYQLRSRAADWRDTLRNNTKFYMNIDYDTIWLQHRVDGSHLDLLENMTLRCGRCNLSTIFHEAERARCPHKHRLDCLAIQEKDFWAPSPAEPRHGDLKVSDFDRATVYAELNPRELKVVISDPTTITGLNFKFGLPIISPRTLSLRYEEGELDDSDREDLKKVIKGWRVKCRELREQLREHKNTAIAELKGSLLDKNLSAIDLSLAEEEYEDWKAWKIPRISCVHVFPTDPNWICPSGAPLPKRVEWVDGVKTEGWAWDDTDDVIGFTGKMHNL